MGDEKLNLVRPDGSLIQVNKEDSDLFHSMGYREESPAEALVRNQAAVKSDYYSSLDERFKTFGEGAVSGLTLGGYEQALPDDMLAETRDRAQTNPGWRLAGDVAGVIAPALIGDEAGIGQLLGKTPAGLVGTVAKDTFSGIKSTVARGAVTGAMEGSIFGAAGEATNAKLSGDPLTAEAVVAGMGWGALWGGGLGAFAGKLEARAAAKAERIAAERAATEEAVKTSEIAKSLGEEKWNSLHGTLQDIKVVTKDAVTTATQALAEDIESLKTPKTAFMSEVTNNMNKAVNLPDTRAAMREIEREFNKAISAGKLGDADKLEAAITRIQDRTMQLGDRLPMNPKAAPAFKELLDRRLTAVKEISDLASVGEQFKNLPMTIEGAVGMRGERLEKMVGSLDQFMNHPAAEFTTMKNAVKEQIANFAEHVGVETTGSPGTQLRNTLQFMKDAGKKSAQEIAGDAAKGELPWWKGKAGQYAKKAAAFGVGNATGKAAQELGARGFGRYLAYDVGKTLTAGLLGLKGAVLGKLADLASKGAPGTIKTLKILGPRAEMLKVRLDGTMDNSGKTQKELMKDRSDEIRMAAGSVKDTLYRGLSPLDMHSPDLAKAMHDVTIAQFQFLADKLPRDPGNAYAQMQSLWGPDKIQTEKFARYYEVFQNPIGAMKGMLESGKVLPEFAEALQNLYPQMYAEFRVKMLETLTDPAHLSKMSYADQVNSALLLNIPMHASVKPKFIAAQMQMFQERNQLQPMRPQVPNAGGRPVSDSMRATQAQKITAH